MVFGLDEIPSVGAVWERPMKAHRISTKNLVPRMAATEAYLEVILKGILRSIGDLKEMAKLGVEYS
jgi:hypothetical protein